MSAFNADALMASPSWKSMARTVLLSRRVLNSPFKSFSWAPFGNVSLAAFLRASPVQTMPSWAQTGTPSGLRRGCLAHIDALLRLLRGRGFSGGAGSDVLADK